MGLLDGKVAIVTGAGRGLGRAEALELAKEGATVVVQDLGVALDGSNPSDDPANEVVSEIEASGGTAHAHFGDVSDYGYAERLINETAERYGDLHIVVNNAGILRDRMLFNMSVEEWDAVIKVHLRGTFLCTAEAARHWRERSKAGDVSPRAVINTSSTSGLFGHIGQANYGAAKTAMLGPPASSTRPGSPPIGEAEELRRIIPVIKGLAPRLKIPLSVDTYRAEVARQALDQGAQVINDISGLRYEPALGGVVARRRAALVLMHMRGRSTEMYQQASYLEVIDEIRGER